MLKKLSRPDLGLRELPALESENGPPVSLFPNATMRTMRMLLPQWETQSAEYNLPLLTLTTVYGVQYGAVITEERTPLSVSNETALRPSSTETTSCMKDIMTVLGALQDPARVTSLIHFRPAFRLEDFLSHISLANMHEQRVDSPAQLVADCDLGRLYSFIHRGQTKYLYVKTTASASEMTILLP